MNDLLGNQTGQLDISRPVIQDPLLRLALRRLFASVERWNRRDGHTDRLDVLACEEALVNSCAQLMERHGSRRATAAVVPTNLRRVRERLADEASVPPSLADLAAMIGLSRYQLLRQFQKTYGLPPHQWLLQRRVEHARVLVAMGLTLAEAAVQSGFADQSHLTRTFRRHHGFTPGAWRNATNPQ